MSFRENVQKRPGVHRQIHNGKQNVKHTQDFEFSFSTICTMEDFEFFVLHFSTSTRRRKLTCLSQCWRTMGLCWPRPWPAPALPWQTPPFKCLTSPLEHLWWVEWTNSLLKGTLASMSIVNKHFPTFSRNEWRAIASPIQRWMKNHSTKVKNPVVWLLAFSRLLNSWHAYCTRAQSTNLQCPRISSTSRECATLYSPTFKSVSLILYKMTKTLVKLKSQCKFFWISIYFYISSYKSLS